jgi:glycosyltransferase involved in cell wall biosynthesis
MPCLNEERTVGECVDRAFEVFKNRKVDGEVIVVDNGSTDNSARIAREHGAKVIHEPKRGYGNAYLTGFKNARGEIIVMADSDGTYDLREMPLLLDTFDDSTDLVMGSRLRGKIEDGAMPWLHRYVGNPLLTAILNILFKAHISDAHCGMRAIKKEALEKMNLKTAGMEFASEMVIKAAKNGLRIKEVPVSYHPRVAGEAKLVSVQDGWRHVRFMFLYKHAMLFLTPGTFFFLLGLMFLLFSSPFRYHTAILGSLFTILGFQVITLGVFSKVYAAIHEIDKPDRITALLMRYNVLEYGLLLGSVIFLAGALMGLNILMLWISKGFGELAQIRNAILSSTFAIVGVQMIFAAIFISVLLLEKKEQ